MAQRASNAMDLALRAAAVDQMVHPAHTKGVAPGVANRKAPGVLVGPGQQPRARTPPGKPPFFVGQRLGAADFKPAACVAPPPWAAAWGSDEHGAWADWAVGNVTQRMRYVAPGLFWMGSPADEEGRFDNEGPRHRVRISQGFWVADTPCTQAFWAAAMGTSPSRFKGDERPVESVSWDDVAQQLLPRLQRALPPGSRVALPTEAQWEYAARAGTETAFHWGNSFDRAMGNFGHETVPVKQYAPNDWGLYDCHGQVLEWCADGMRSYEKTARAQAELEDPAGPAAAGALRVVRGGGWILGPRLARSAFRYADHPGGRFHFLGLRLVLVPAPPRSKASPAEGPEGRAPGPEGPSQHP